MVEGKPPQSITIAAPVEPAQSEPDQTHQRRKTAEEYRKVWRGKRSKPKVAQQQPIIVPDGKPSFGLFFLGFMTVFGSIGFPFLLDSIFIDSQLYYLLDDNVCCFLCNGIAIGLGIIGFYCIQYGNWEDKNGAKYSAVFSYLSAGIVILAGIASFWIWLEMPNWW
tara:strand:- start:275 stop:769 length:495 start_codon:yes stop_codon:yes gene_type:complete